MSHPQEHSHPHPNIGPDRVIETQLLCFQHCDTPTPNHGIELAYRFASPENRAWTGPIQRFICMIRNPLYECLVNFDRSRFEPVSEGGSRWKITIEKEGVGSVFIWELSRQEGGVYAGCWMTDSVIKIN
eukprot:TRINITY_DN1831_c0_g1_i1.p1 TRINITY_DN1831_c0_g1~~TRINITY_DN1831_c0_g1_i1.p1  ORF type:complete len:129 (-),score=2.71 TRINITY_DN1831_c0_g1_i1:4-390(-)